MMRFYMRYVAADPSGYFVTRWDRSTPIEVIADTKDEAFQKVRNVVGDSPRGKRFAIKLDRISEIVCPESLEE